LITAHCIDEASTLDNSLRTYEDEVNLVHDVGDGRVEDNGARNACRGEGFGSFDSGKDKYIGVQEGKN